MEIDETNTQESASLKKEFDSGETRISDLPKMQDNMKTQQFKNLEIPSASPQPNISISYRLDPQKPLGPHISESTNTRYALLLRDYNVSNTEELVRLIAQSGQIPLGKAKLLLKTPSVLKSSLTNLEVQTLTSQFNRVGARLQAITMEQLQAIKNKQSLQALETTAAPAPSDSTPSPRDTEKYAILLQNVDETHKGETLHFLASLTGLPIESLRRALRTPAVAAKNISRQEVDQISKQFKGLNAQINVLTMQELQELVAQKRKT
jgi:ribosomal protein L7/L12